MQSENDFNVSNLELAIFIEIYIPITELSRIAIGLFQHRANKYDSVDRKREPQIIIIIFLLLSWINQTCNK